MNIIKKGAAAIIRSWIIANFDLDEIARSAQNSSLDEMLGEGTLQEYMTDYDEADRIASDSSIKGALLAYFVLAPFTAILIILNKIAKWQISKHQ